ncbi:MAG: ankyrin repeat domain-containing protein, partial [Planctomycetota bacterium]
VTVLIEAGADVNAKNNDGKTPLMYAKSGGSRLIKLLKAAGARE